jgi:hypothetical protein
VRNLPEAAGFGAMRDEVPMPSGWGFFILALQLGRTLAFVAVVLCAMGWGIGALLLRLDAELRQGVENPSFSASMERTKLELLQLFRLAGH